MSLVRDGADEGITRSRSPYTHALVDICNAFFVGVRRPECHISRAFKDLAQLSGCEVVYENALCIRADGQQLLVGTEISVVASVYILGVFSQISTEVEDVVGL